MTASFWNSATTGWIFRKIFYQISDIVYWNIKSCIEYCNNDKVIIPRKINSCTWLSRNLLLSDISIYHKKWIFISSAIEYVCFLYSLSVSRLGRLMGIILWHFLRDANHLIINCIFWFQCKDWAHLGSFEKHVPKTPPAKITRLTFPLPTLSCLSSFPFPCKSQEDLPCKSQDLWLHYGQYGQQTSFERWPFGHTDHPPDYAGQGKGHHTRIPFTVMLLINGTILVS